MSKIELAELTALHETAARIAAEPALNAASTAIAASILETDDIQTAMNRTAFLILALETEEQAAKIAKEAAKARLLEAMSETNPPAVWTESHTVTLSKGRVSYIVTDPAQVPAALKTTPPQPQPEPDAKLITAAWKVAPVPGTERRNGAPYLSFKIRA